MQRVLIIRFSSIGDIVLCSPVLRNLKNKFPDLKIDVLTKKDFAFVWEGNPHIHKILKWGDSEDTQVWKQAPYELILDLHNNLRSRRVKIARWDCPSLTLNKQNFRKMLFVAFKKPILKIKPIVERYADMLNLLGIEDDHLGLDFYGVQKFENDKTRSVGFDALPETYIAIALGGSFATKQIPLKTYRRFFNHAEAKGPFVLLGGSGDMSTAEALTTEFPNKCINLTGKLTLGQSAWVVQKAQVLCSGDTGLAHIGAALGVPILWIWGNTTPDFGMLSPVNPHNGAIRSMEIPDLKCRPCSKLGYPECPKKHFQCMDHDPQLWFENLEKLSRSV